MIIPVNKQWRITSNAHCYQVEQYEGKRNDGRERWQPVTFHSDFKGALSALAERRTRLIDSSVPNEIIAAIQKIRDEVISSADLFKNLVD